MTESTRRYNYIKMMLEESGIDFKNISKDEIIMTCKKYNGIISNKNYLAVLSVINEIYECCY